MTSPTDLVDAPEETTTPPLADAQRRWDADYVLPDPRSDRPTTRMHRVEHLVSNGLLSLFAGMRPEIAARRMGAFMRGFGPMLRPVHARGDANLQLIYPDMTPAERSAILRDCWTNLGMTVAEMPHVSTLRDRVTFKNIEIIDEMVARGERALYVSGHFANWELFTAVLFARGMKYGFVYRAANNPLIDGKIIEMRAAVASRRQIPKGKRGTRDLLKVFSEGLSLCMLTDQKLNDGISSPLLGYPAMTTPAAARMALKEGVPMIPLQIVREPESRFTLTVHPPVEAARTGDLKTDVQALTDGMNEAIGRMILDRPDQWLWFHRRWPKKLMA